MQKPLKIALTVVSGPCVGEMARLSTFPIVVGRSESSGLRLSMDPGVSRHHAEIDVTEDGDVVVVDHNSRLGTFVGRERISRKILEPGTLVRFSASEVRLDWSVFEHHKLAAPAAASKRWQPWPRWIYAVGALLLVLVGVSIRALEPMSPSPALRAPNQLQLARDARDRGNLAEAIGIAQALLRSASPEENDAAVVKLLVDCKRLKQRFDMADSYERHLHLDSALDEWRIMLLNGELLPTNSPLRTWVATNQIYRLEMELERGRSQRASNSD